MIFFLILDLRYVRYLKKMIFIIFFVWKQCFFSLFTRNFHKFWKLFLRNFWKMYLEKLKNFQKQNENTKNKCFLPKKYYITKIMLLQKTFCWPYFFNPSITGLFEHPCITGGIQWTPRAKMAPYTADAIFSL